jgi:N-acyl-D-aspartate/D-glutamate deacylase
VASLIAGWGEAMQRFFSATPEDRLAMLAEGEFRATLRAAPEDPSVIFAPEYGAWVISASASRHDLLGTTLADAATAARCAPSDFLCDLVRADALTTELQVPGVNRDRAAAATLCADEHTLIGLGDAGAHVRSVTSYTYPTDLLARVVRDEDRLPLEAAVERITSRPAKFFGLRDRGELRPGFAADLCVIDLDHLALAPLTVVNDLPGGASRLYREGRGYVAVLVDGEITVDRDRLTGNRPGQLLYAAG